MRYSSNVCLINNNALTECAALMIKQASEASAGRILWLEFLDLNEILIRFRADIQHSPGRENVGCSIWFDSPKEGLSEEVERLKGKWIPW